MDINNECVKFRWTRSSDCLSSKLKTTIGCKIHLIL